MFVWTGDGKCRTKDARGESSVEWSKRNGEASHGQHEGCINISLALFMFRTMNAELKSKARFIDQWRFGRPAAAMGVVVQEIVPNWKQGRHCT